MHMTLFFVAVCEACLSSLAEAHAQSSTAAHTPCAPPAFTVFTHLELRNGKAILCLDLGSHTTYLSHVPKGGGIMNPHSSLVTITPLGEGLLGTGPLKRLGITSAL